MKTFERIGVLTSGGDAPGMNATIRAVTRAALANGVEVMGIYEGYKGLMEGNMKLFDERDVSNIINHGGTMLFSARSPEFKTEEGMARAIKVCEENHINGIVAIGGDGTFRGATDLSERGVACIGLPGTIDNDITATDYSIGYDTAMNTVIEMVDRLRDTCESHLRCNVIEVMGRNSGYIALNTGIAVGASIVVVSELPFDEDKAIEAVLESKKEGKRNFIVIVSEGAEGFAEPFTKRFAEKTGIETKFARLAHVVRGGSPSLRDRVLATEMGTEAVNLLLEGKSNLVVCNHDNKICSMDIGSALTLDRMYKGKLKEGDLDSYTQEEIQQMREFCAKKSAEFKKLYEMSYLISR
ncbi:MAG: 6-phosphofructokinase [Clostridiales bacterium]|nr:6-phosphofructokinase [Clostridiales bacterium]